MSRSRKKNPVIKDKKHHGYWRCIRSNWKIQIKKNMNNFKEAEYDDLYFENYRAIINQWDVCDWKIHYFKIADSKTNPFWDEHFSDYYSFGKKRAYRK